MGPKAPKTHHFSPKGLIIPRKGLETLKKAIISSSGDLILRPTNEKRQFLVCLVNRNIARMGPTFKVIKAYI